MTQLTKEHIEGFLLGMKHAEQICEKRAGSRKSTDAGAIRAERVSLSMLWRFGHKRQIMQMPRLGEVCQAVIFAGIITVLLCAGTY